MCALCRCNRRSHTGLHRQCQQRSLHVSATNRRTAAGITVAQSGLMSEPQPLVNEGLDRRTADVIGLTGEEARERLLKAGPNEIKRGEATSSWKLLAGQFGSPL